MHIREFKIINKINIFCLDFIIYISKMVVEEP